MSNITIRLDIPAIMGDVDTANDAAIFALSEQALTDSNFYCKQDQGGLIDSSLIFSDTHQGLLLWETPYAKRQYYLEAAHRDINPNAQMMWFHKAKDIHLEEWIAMYAVVLKRGL